VRVRIVERPKEKELEGVDLDCLQPGSVRDVSPTIGAWLIVQGYAYPEMRHVDDEFNAPHEREQFHGRERRRN
jgi:hypothetical protein